MSIADQLRPCLEEMTRSERKVASRFLGNPDDFAFMTLERAAAETGVSTTTVLRFCRRLNFLGYKDFQEALRQDMKRQPNLPEKYRRTVAQNTDALLEKTVRMDMQCLQETFQEIPGTALAKTLEQIHTANRVYTFGMKESFALAHYLYTRLLSVRKDVYLLNAGGTTDVGQVAGITKQDVCIVFAFHRYSQQTLRLLPMLQRQGAAVIVITSEPMGEVAPYATVLLLCRVDAGGIKNTAVAPICLADYLCNAVAVLRGVEALEHMRQLEMLYRESGAPGN